MGQVHARSFTRVPHHFPELPLRADLVAVADPLAERRELAVDAYGFEVTVEHWEELLDLDLDVLCVTGPNYVHRDIAVAAAKAGLNLWLEKPAGRNAAETRDIQRAVQHAGVQSTVGFNYRNAPAVEEARRLVLDGTIGDVEHATVRMLADYACHPHGALSWRFRNDLAGSGVLGDLVSHGVDLARYVVGELAGVVAERATFIERRPEPSGAGTHFDVAPGGPLGPVQNEDYVAALLRFASGARGVLESSRVAVGEQCTYGIEVHGRSGALAWDFRRMGELQVCRAEAYQNASWETVYVGPGSGEYGSFQPGGGMAMGYDDLKVIEAANLLRSIAASRPHGATIDDAVVAAETVEKMLTSVQEHKWVAL